MGTVIFTDAELKIFLVASTEIRAKRRYDQLLGKGQPANYENILRDLQERDARDQNRASAPLVMADDAILLNADNLTIPEEIDFVMQNFQTKMCK
jgi:cytidylate kinase